MTFCTLSFSKKWSSIEHLLFRKLHRNYFEVHEKHKAVCAQTRENELEVKKGGLTQTEVCVTYLMC